MWLLRLYPQRWRQRYEAEMCAVLEEHPVRWATLADLAIAALATRLDPKHRKEEAMARQERNRTRYTRCSFCGKGPDQVRKLVAGPGVYICDACIELCNEVLATTPDKPQPQPPAGPNPTPPVAGGSRKAKWAWVRGILGGPGHQRCVPSATRSFRVCRRDASGQLA